MNCSFTIKPKYLAIAAGCGVAALAQGLPMSQGYAASNDLWLDRADHEKSVEIKRPEVMSV
jgi:hypothetical protein